MKKIFSVIMICLIVFSMTSCDMKKKADSNSNIQNLG